MSQCDAPCFLTRTTLNEIIPRKSDTLRKDIVR